MCRKLNSDLVWSSTPVSGAVYRVIPTNLHFFKLKKDYLIYSIQPHKFETAFILVNKFPRLKLINLIIKKMNLQSVIIAYWALLNSYKTYL